MASPGPITAQSRNSSAIRATRGSLVQPTAGGSYPFGYTGRACSSRSFPLSGRYFRQHHRTFDTSITRRPALTCMARRIRYRLTTAAVGAS
jgi:hypothetical protein